MEKINYYIDIIRNLIWGTPLLLFLVGTGIYLTFVLKGVQFRYLLYAIKQVFAPSQKKSEGDITHFKALMTTLAGTIGTGSIVGVSTALTIGGVGALFWMWVTALFGMATKYTESLLAVKYREMDERGEMIGGPMEYMEKGLGKKWMAVAFAVFGVIACIGTGMLVQVNSIAEATGAVWGVDPLVCGIVVALLTGLIIVGGVKSIGSVAGILVPFMALFYLAGGTYIIALHYQDIPLAFYNIFTQAFTAPSAVGGVAGFSMMTVIQMGVSRSVFSNEAGLGISSIAAAAAQTDAPARQALITMTGALLSTMIICTITGLVVSVTGVLGEVGGNGEVLSGASLAIHAFNSTISGGSYIVSIGLILFAFSTIIAWAYYGEKCCEYLCGERSVRYFRIIYILLVIPGAVAHMSIAWSIADIANGLMVIPNLFALIGLSRVAVSETERFIETFEKK